MRDIFIAVIAFAFGVLVMDVAHDQPCMASRPTTPPRVVMDSDYPPAPVPLSEKVCAHYQARGEGWKCT